MVSRIANWVFLWVVTEKVVRFFKKSRVLMFLKKISTWVWQLGKGILIYTLFGAACGVAVFLAIGGMGLALMGTAIGIGVLPLTIIGIIVALAIMGVINIWRTK